MWFPCGYILKKGAEALCKHCSQSRIDVKLAYVLQAKLNSPALAAHWRFQPLLSHSTAIWISSSHHICPCPLLQLAMLMILEQKWELWQLCVQLGFRIKIVKNTSLFFNIISVIDLYRVCPTKPIFHLAGTGILDYLMVFFFFSLWYSGGEICVPRCTHLPWPLWWLGGPTFQPEFLTHTFTKSHILENVIGRMVL